MKEYRKCLIVAVVVVLVVLGLCVCPNNCNNHGTCVGSSCVCYERNGIDDGKSYTGNDCSLLKCMDGNSFSFVSSQSTGISGSSYTRELHDDTPMNIRLLADVKMVLIADYSKNTGYMWKVDGIYELLKYLPKMGGSIQCSYKVGEDSHNDQSVDVIGVFDNKTTAFVRFATAVTDKETSITCNKVISKRSTMVYYKTDGKITNVQKSPETIRRQLTDSTLTWENYGKIFKELGILEEEVKQENGGSSGEGGGSGGGEGGEGSRRRRRNLQSKSYVNSNFTFACFTPPTTTDSNPVAVTIYEKVKAEYKEVENGDDKLVFTFTGSTLPTANSVCNCLMSGDFLPMKIEQTEMNSYVSGSGNSYTLGKYAKSGLDSNGYAVIKTTETVVVTSSPSTVSLTIESGDYDNLFTVGRVVYVDVLLSSGKVSEKEVKVTEAATRIRQLTGKTVELDRFTAGDIVLPYIKLHSLNPLTPIKPSTPDSKSSAYYKVYNLADKLIKQLDPNFGGLLKCSYTNSQNVNVVTSVDVKGYVSSSVTVDSKNVDASFSYVVLSEDEFDNINSLKCTEIATKRKDYTMFNPVKLSKDGELTWEGYGTLTKFTADTSDKVNFACYTPSDKEKEEITIYSVSGKVDGDSKDVKFTITNADGDKSPKNGDICYLAAEIVGNGVEAITDLLESDLGAYIRQGEGDDKNYYFGKYEKPIEPIKVEYNDNSLPVFIFDNKNNKITESTIEIVENDIQNDDLEYFQIGQTIYIEVTNGDKTIQYNHTAVIISLDSRLLLSSESTKTFKYSPKIQSGFNPTGVLAIASPVESAKIDATLDESKYLYKVSGFYDILLSGLPSLGGKVQCKYVEAKEDKTEMGVIDVKTYVKGESSYSYIQFSQKMEDKPENTNLAPAASTYYLQDITCSGIISRREDMTFFNPTTIKAGTNYNTDSHILTWKGYASIFETIKYDTTSVKFACYNPNKEGNKIITILDGVTVATSNDDIEFTFSDKNEPTEDDICHLLTTSTGGEIDIENSELSDLIRKDDGVYYYGKYIDVKNDTIKVVKNDDGSQTVILGTSLFSDDKDDKDGDGKVYVGKIDDENSPSIAYPPSLISDGIKKLMVAGTILIFKQGGTTQRTQVLKVKINDKNKIELSLSNPIVFLKGRLLATVPSTPSKMTFASESSVHPPLECSGQGLCNRESGLCECYDGFSGSACQRLDCPNNCNGNGRCVPLSELLSNTEISNNYEGYGNKHESKDVEFENQVYGCLCDKRHRGYDCSLIECPSSKDPEEATNAGEGSEYRDCSGRGICNYNTGVCECFDGFSGEGCQTQTQMM